MEDERKIFEFITPIPGKGAPWNRWHLCVGGWEISGENEEELKKIAIELCKKELSILEILRGEENV